MQLREGKAGVSYSVHAIKHRFTHLNKHTQKQASHTHTLRFLLLIDVTSSINFRQGLDVQRQGQALEERCYRSQRVNFRDSPRSPDFS